MPRGNHTYADRREENDQLARAGARSRERIGAEVADIDQRNLAAQREARMAESQALDDEVQRWNFEKEKTFDANAKARLITNSQRAIEATNKLFKVDAKKPTSADEINAIGAEYADLLDPEIGDKRFIAQMGFNQKIQAQHQLVRERAAETKAAAATRAAERVADAAAKKAEADADRAANLETVTKLIDSGAKQSGFNVGKGGAVSQSFKPPEQPSITDINTRLKAEYDIELSALQNPAANMRRVDPTKKDEDDKNAWGDPSGSHYAFDIPAKDPEDDPRTVLIPVKRFKEYADEYAKVNGGQPAAPKAAPAADTGTAKAAATPAATATPLPADIDDAIGGSFTGDKYLPAKTDVRRNKEGKLTGLPVLTRAQAQTLVSRGVMTPFIDAETGKVLRPQ